MKHSLIEISFPALTIGLYLLSLQLYRKWRHPLLTPILTAVTVIICFLVILDFSYETYMTGAVWIDKLLGPAVVALAYPLYIHRSLLMQYTFPLLLCIVTGVCVGVFSGLFFAQMIGTSQNVILSLLPKSVTTPVAMEITRVSGGMPSIVVVFAMIAGIGGVITAPYLFKWFKIKSDMSRGLGLGAASHAIGTSKALEYGSQAAATSSVAMTISALVASIIIPIIASWV
ncbi:LrgB family protein [Pseudalkalibacillus salsuginis]|uniref:LrgB family protein n=1 Tax=Pseudalkalibacillus salsuginis TaxID=2910972 RepID=UPI001F28408C|nr:LrgB family protein [Pseudalkalibacillus salsuginis]MCF6408840.1 LrgB family protein [Pseudalkalibacillus salsuginis]